MNNIFKILVFIIIVFACVFIIIGKDNTIKELKNNENIKDALIAKNCMGIIEGSLMFPSEKIPDNMYVCARNINSMYEYCTDKNITDERFKYKKGYHLEVPAGDYVVAGVYPEGLGSLKVDNGMEFKYTSCNGENNCKNEPLLKFRVECNKISENINLFDGWRTDFFRKFFSKEEQLRLSELEKEK